METLLNRFVLLCPEQDSNLHASQHSHLKRARLPFRHLGFCGAKLEQMFGFCKCYVPYLLDSICAKN